MFEKNPYWNTMWSNRDEEFYWSGVKGGATVMLLVLGIPLVCMTISYIISESENKKN